MRTDERRHHQRDFKFDLKSVDSDNTSAARVVVGGHDQSADKLDLRTLGVMEKSGAAMGIDAEVLGHLAAAIAMLASQLGKRVRESTAGTQRQGQCQESGARTGQRRKPPPLAVHTIERSLFPVMTRSIGGGPEPEAPVDICANSALKPNTKGQRRRGMRCPRVRTGATRNGNSGCARP